MTRTGIDNESNFEKNINSIPFLKRKNYSSIIQGTFGELLQGSLSLEKGGEFLISFPINRDSKSIFYQCNTLDKVHVIPRNLTKSQKAIDLYLDRVGIKLTGIIHIDSLIPKGKGLASSSADMLSAIRAVNKFLNLKINTYLESEILGQIEPTDTVMHNKCVAYNHVTSELIEEFGILPDLVIVAVDYGGIVDTYNFNKEKHDFTKDEVYFYNDLYSKLKIAINENDLRSIGYVTTESCRLNQRKNMNTYYNSMIKISEKYGGLGIVCCHSGTMIGIILDPSEKEYCQKILAIFDNIATFSEPIIFTNIGSNDDLSK